jgi:predicted TIM-barrel fold metal-dependent hydrolase
VTVLDELKIIDVDAHITEPADLWTSRAPEKWRDRVPRVVEGDDGGLMWSIDGVMLGRALGASVIKRGRVKTPGTEFMTWDPSENDPSAYDMKLRLDVMDEMGVWAQILYPNAAGFGAQRFGDITDPELKVLCATIFNDAMLEIQEESNGRLLPMPLLPWWDVDASVAEATRCASNGFRGVNMCSDPQSRGLPDLGDPVWDRLWEVCSDEQLPVNFHIGASETSLTWFGTSPWPSQDDERKLAIGSAMMYLSNARIIANLIYSGVLERFPQLKIVSVESGVGWLPFFLESLDYQQTESAPRSVDQLSMKPSDYFRRQIYGCFWFEIPILPMVLDVLGDDHVMFETDYPHPTCLYPDPRARLVELEPRIGGDSLRKVLCDNAAGLYRVELPPDAGSFGGREVAQPA